MLKFTVDSKEKIILKSEDGSLICEILSDFSKVLREKEGKEAILEDNRLENKGVKEKIKFFIDLI